MDTKVWMKRGLSLLLTLAMVLSFLPSGILRSNAVTNTTEVVDPSTMDSWQDFFDLQNLTTQNAGMVWTDKSVFTEVPDSLKNLQTLEGHTESVTMEALEDNFLVALSVMASNKTITGYSTIPTDTMLILDVSGSMNQEYNQCSDEMVQAANAAIKELLNTNRNNRVGVVLYSGNHSFGNSNTGTAQVILPLGRYTTSDGNGRYLNHTTTTTGQGKNQTTTSTVSVVSGVVIEDTNNPPASENNDTSKDVLGGTYIQNGIYKAMNQFLAADTVVADGKIQAGTTRMPIIVLMSDGAPTAATASFTQPGESHMGNGSGNHTNATIGFVTQLTAAYAKAKVTEHYDRAAKFYTLGLGMDEMGDTEKSVASRVLNPVKYADDSQTDQFDTYWNDYNNLAAGGRMTVEWDQPTGNNNKTEKKRASVTKSATAISQRYVDEFFDAEASGNVSLEQALVNAFKEIVDEIILQSRYTPTLVDSGDHDLDGYVSFIDHIGEHMDVTDIKGMVIGDHYLTGEAFASYIVTGKGGTMENPSELGDEFIRSVKTRLGIDSTADAQALVQQAYYYGQIAYDTETGDFSNYVGWYSDADGNYLGFWHEGTTVAPPAGAVHINKSYGFLGEVDDSYGVRSGDMMYTTVRIREEIATGDVTLAWAIPSGLIPTLSYEVRLNGDTYGSPLDSLTVSGAENGPIRLVFEVALREDIHNYNITEKISSTDEHYNAATGTYTFYTNDFVSANPEDATNTYAYFEPSKENECYYYILDSVIYTDKAGENPYTGASKPTGGTYYHEYYVYSKNGGTQRTVVEISADALADATQKDGHWVIPKGTEYQLLETRQHEKDPNATETMPYVVWPVIDKDPDVQYHAAAVLGNNGKLTVTPATGIKVTKTLTETVADADNIFTFTLSGADHDGVATLVRPGANADGSDKTETLTFTDGKVTFTVAADETVYIIDLDAGNFTLTEANHAAYSVESGTGAIVVTDKQITDAAVVNTPKTDGNLYITKGIVAAEGYTVPDSVKNNSVFTLTVDLGDLANQEFAVAYSGNAGLTGVTTDANGSFTVTLKHTETFEVFKIPQGTLVTVTENDPDSCYTVSYRSRDYSGAEADDNNQVTIGADVNSTVVVTNTYKPAPTEVKLNIEGTKTFVNESNSAHEFTFKVQQWNGTEWVDMEGKTGSVAYNATESGDKTFTIGEVLAGITYDKPGTYAYQILEVIPEDPVDGLTYDKSLHTFTVTVTDAGGQLTASVATHDKTLEAVDGTFTVEPKFVNAYHTAQPYIDVLKVVENPTESPLVNMQGFEFQLYNATVSGDVWTQGELADIEYSDAVGEARFVLPAYNSTQAGTYHFILKEANTHIDGWTYDTKEYHITVVVAVDESTKNVTATVSVEDAVNGKAVFTNTYNPEPATLSLDTLVNKDLTGRELKAGEFTFEIRKNNTGQVAATGTNDAEGNVKFDKVLTFTEVGKYEFDVVEVPGSLGGITYDGTIYDLVVEITDGGNGQLTATYYFEDAIGDTVTFNNTYNTKETSLVLGGTKTLTGRTLLAEGFSFTLSENGEVLQTVYNGADGTYVFEAISYTEPGDHVYTIREVNEGKTGITYDDTVHTVTVKVVDDGEGNLVARINDVAVTEKKGLDFTNRYAPVGFTFVNLSGTKTLVGRDLKDGEFTFFLIDEAGNIIDTVKNAAAGAFAFAELSFNKVGTYTYRVREEIGSESGMTYDSTIYTVTVTVTDNGVGGFANEVQISGSGKLAFTNKYVAPATANIRGVKTLDGRDIADGEFTFVLTDAHGNVVEEVTNVGREFAFSTLTFHSEGQYLYTVTEKKGSDATVIYDETVYHAHITVTMNQAGNALVAEVECGVPSDDHTANSMLSFTNVIREEAKAHLEATKVLEGRPLTAGEFTFELKDSTGTVIQTKTNAANGTVTFDPLTFGQEGTYTFTITEVKGDNAYMAYDGHTVNATVVVTAPEDNGPFQAAVTYSGSTTFTNKPAGDVPMSFSFKKVKEDGTALPGAEFTLSHVNCNDCNDTIADITATSDANGIVAFNGVPSGHQWLLTETVTPKNYKTTAQRHVTDVYGVVYIDGEVAGTGTDMIVITNVAADHTEVILKGVKILMDGDNQIAAENNAFAFELLDADRKVIDTQRNMATAEEAQAVNVVSEFIFGAITLKATGTYTYYIREVQGDNLDVIYDETLYKVVVTVIQEGNSLKVSKVEYSVDGKSADGVVFTNKLRGDAVANIKATKQLEGKTLNAGDYTFYLKDSNGEIIQTVTNDATGNITFSTLTYGEEGEWHYTITEQAGTDPYTTYDSKVIYVHVDVKAEGDAYVANVTYTDAEGYVIRNTFKNVYSDRGYAVLELEKVDENGIALPGAEFTLTHTCEDCDADIDPIVATSRQDGMLIMEHIPSGHTYTLSETKTPEGFTPAKDRTVVVSFGVVTVDGVEFVVGKPVQIVNYDVGAAYIEGTKVLDGRDLKAGEFEFVLKDSEGNPIETVTNDANGNFRFKVQQYSEPGTYTYTVSEVKGDLAGVTYDEAIYVVTVVVTEDESTGELSVEVTVTKTDASGTATASGDTVYTDDITFTNTYKAAEVKVVIDATKKLEGRDLKAGEFEFILIQEGNPLSVVSKNAADGSVSFNLVFQEAGQYKYTLTEKVGTLAGVSYDDTAYHFIVDVTDPGNGQLEYEIIHTDATFTAEVAPKTFVFKNTYDADAISVPIQVTKILNGRDMAAGEFEFILEQVGNPLSAMSRNDEDGIANFSLIFNEVGQYKYILTEKAGTSGGVTYDDTVYYFIVNVTDPGNGQLAYEIIHTDSTFTAEVAPKDFVFENAYKASSVTVPVVATKTLTGRDLVDGEFEFVLVRLDRNITMITNNDADGQVMYHLSFTSAGEYHFRLSETAGTASGVKYDDTVYYFTVIVTDPGNGQLEYEIVYTDSEGNPIELEEMTFVNEFKEPDDLCVPIVIHKTVINKNGGCMGPWGFKFLLTDSNGVKVTSVSDLTGLAGYMLSFTKDDVGKTFNYIVTEINTGIEDVNYSSAIYRIRITISLNEETNELEADIRVNGMPVSAIVLEFINIYEPELPVPPTDPEPTEPKPTDPKPTDPEPTEPKPTEPKPTEPKPTEPEPTEPEPTEPKPTEPTEPKPTEPKPTEPKPTEPKPTEPEDPDTPDTGDHSGIFQWTAVMLLSVTALAVLLLTDKRGKKDYRR